METIKDEEVDKYLELYKYCYIDKILEHVINNRLFMEKRLNIFYNHPKIKKKSVDYIINYRNVVGTCYFNQFSSKKNIFRDDFKFIKKILNDNLYNYGLIRIIYNYLYRNNKILLKKILIKIPKILFMLNFKEEDYLKFFGYELMNDCFFVENLKIYNKSFFILSSTKKQGLEKDIIFKKIKKFENHKDIRNDINDCFFKNDKILNNLNCKDKINLLDNNSEKLHIYKFIKYNKMYNKFFHMKNFIKYKNIILYSINTTDFYFQIKYLIIKNNIDLFLSILNKTDINKITFINKCLKYDYFIKHLLLNRYYILSTNLRINKLKKNILNINNHYNFYFGDIKLKKCINFKSDISIVFEYMKIINNKNKFEEITTKYKFDKLFLTKSCYYNNTLYKFINGRFFSSKEIILNALKSGNLEILPSSIYERVLFDNNTYLSINKELMIKLIINSYLLDKYSFNHLSLKVKENKDLIIEMLNNNCKFNYFYNNISDNKDIAKILFNKDPMLIKIFSHEIINEYINNGLI